ncbi:hypothetical protein [Yoonia sp. MH D7]
MMTTRIDDFIVGHRGSVGDDELVRRVTCVGFERHVQHDVNNVVKSFVDAGLA